MTKVAALRELHDCGKCGEELIAPDRCTFVSEDRVCNFWVCAHCGNEFETYCDLKLPVPQAIVQSDLAA